MTTGLPLPPWLDKPFLETILQGGDDKETNVTVVEFNAKPAVAAGYNYSSYVFRVNVEYKVGKSADLHSEALIVKAPIDKGIVNVMQEQLNFFGREPKIYQELLPKLSSKIKFEFGPKSFYCPLKNGMVLKDLTSEGYVMGDRFKQLDLSHCKQVVTALAKLHAASVSLHHENPTLVEQNGIEPVFREDSPMAQEFKGMFMPSAVHFLEILKQMGDQEKIVEFISNRIPTLWESVLKAFEPQKGRLNVLNHGDCWVANILFKHNDAGEAIDIKLIDYQALRYASPAADLVDFLWTSGNEDVRENHQQELFKTYLQVLNKSLEDLGCDERLTKEELDEHFKSMIDCTIIGLCNRVPFLLSEPDDVPDFTAIDPENFSMEKMMEKFLNIYNGKHFRALLPGMLRNYKAWISLYSEK